MLPSVTDGTAALHPSLHPKHGCYDCTGGYGYNNQCIMNVMCIIKHNGYCHYSVMIGIYLRN